MENIFKRNLHGNGEHFPTQKKEESSSLSISEISDSKRGGYLSAWKALLKNSFR